MPFKRANLLGRDKQGIQHLKDGFGGVGLEAGNTISPQSLGEVDTSVKQLLVIFFKLVARLE